MQFIAKYHCVKAAGTPSNKSRVSEMKKWLIDQGVPLPDKPIKENVWPIIQKILKENPKYVGDQMILDAGHIPLHLRMWNLAK